MPGLFFGINRLTVWCITRNIILTDGLKYEIYQKDKFQAFEGTCMRCGECCGSKDGDPCANLVKDDAATIYYCKACKDRLGPQKTVSGKIFNCISIRDIVKMDLLRPNCTYDKRRNLFK